VIFAAWKMVPPYVTEYQLEDKMQEQARFAVVNRYTDEQIRENIYKVVQDLDIANIKREDIKVTATQAAVKITMEYTVPVDLLVYKTELHFSPSSENKSLM
jgi:Zn/Cd-binding protein ZinT